MVVCCFDDKIDFLKKSLTLLILLFASGLYAQENVKSVRAGLLGVWFQYENAISELGVMDYEIGYIGGLYGSGNKVNVVFTTALSIEPKWYYNLNRRLKKEKNTRNNTGNYLSVEFQYIPNWLTSTNVRTQPFEDPGVAISYTFVPKYGFRRSFSDKFNFEFAFGIGNTWYEDQSSEIAAALDIKFGYIFQ